MDEIVIEEKKYISSKQAAKITGYAKDYVGQLCREGRVPARFVGRSWYVLEAAIQDHRFGTDEHEPKKATEDKESQPQSVHPTWESPRYEAYPEVEDSWRAWFDRFEHKKELDNATYSISSNREEPEQGDGKREEREKEEIKIPEEKRKEGEDVQIPIHVYQPPPEDFLPLAATVAPKQSNIPVIKRQIKSHRGAPRIVQAAFVVSALVSVALAALGSGYFDPYILSSRQTSMIAGVVLYSR